MNTFKNAQYTITTSLYDTETIYIKIVNNISYETYEGTFEKSDFRLSFNTKGRLTIINKCFAAFTSGKKSAYSAKIELEPNNCMLVIFDCILDGAIGVDFGLRLKQKSVSGDTILSAELEKHEQLIAALTKRLESAEKMIEMQNKQIAELENLRITVERIVESIRVINFKQKSGDSLTFSISASNITIHEFANPIDLKEIKSFYNLNTLTIHEVNDHILSLIANSSLRILKIHPIDNISIAFVKQFPNLEELYISFLSSRNGRAINVTEAIHTLNTTSHKIKKIMLTGCTVGHQLQQSYCEKNGIELIIQ